MENQYFSEFEEPIPSFSSSPTPASIPVHPKTSGTLFSTLTLLLAGAALGAIAMYALDPQAGTRRREEALDTALKLKDEVTRRAKDLTHRTQDLIAHASPSFRESDKIVH